MSTAAAYEHVGKLNEAVIEFKNVLRVQPDNGEARFRLGSIALRTGSPQAAEYHLRKALEANYEPALVLRALAEALFAQAAFDKLLEATRSSDHGEPALQPEILTLRGHAQLQLEKIDEAIASFEEALARNPGHASALLGRARIAMMRGSLAGAKKHLAEALAADPRSIDAWLMKGDLDQIAGDAEAALAAYESALAINRNGFAANLNLASIYMNAKKFDQARVSIAVVQKALPQNPAGSYLLALLEFRLGNYAAASDALKHVQKIAPNYVPATALAGMVAFASGQQEEAEKLLAQATARFPSNVQLRKLYAAVLLRSDKVKSALEILELLAKTVPNDHGILALMAEAKFQDNDIAAARRYFEQASKLNPGNAHLRLGLGLSRLAAGSLDRALADLEAAVDLGSTAADAFIVTSLIGTKQYDKAAEAVARVEKRRPNDALTLNLRGSVLAAQGDLSGARRAFEKAVELQPNKLAAVLNLAQLDYRSGHSSAARERLQNALDRNKNSIPLLLALADLDIAEKRLTQAKRWLEQAVDAAPTAVRPRIALARLQLVEGDHEGVVASTSAALRSAPENTEALNMLAYSQLRLGRISESAAAYSELVRIAPAAAASHYGLSGAQSAAGNHAAAEISLRRALKLKPDFPEALVSLASLQLRLARYDDMRKTLADLRQRYPKLPQRLYLDGDLARAQKQPELALQSYRAAFAVQPNADAFRKIYDLLLELKDARSAQELANHWLRMYPEDTEIRLFLADRAVRNANYAVAAEHYQYLAAKQPNRHTLLHNLRWVYERMNDPRALDVAEQAYKAAPQNAGALFDLGRLLIDTPQLTRAIELLEQARVLEPTAQPLRYHLARAYAKAGKNQLAREELQQLLRGRESFEERTEAEALLKRLQR